MDPYEHPRTKISDKCLTFWGTRRFAEEFLAEMETNSDDLPLEDFCQVGQPSATHEVEAFDLVIDKDNPRTVKGHFKVKFYETTITSCRRVGFSDPLSGRIDFELRFEDGVVEFERPTAGKRQYEPNEF